MVLSITKLKEVLLFLKGWLNNMIINSSKDIISFFISFFVGIVLSIIYDIIKTFRLVNKSKKYSIFVQDIFFSLIASIITYTLLFVRSQGEIRWFILISEFSGFIIFKLYLSNKFININKKIFSFIKNKIIFPLKNIFNKFINFLNKKLDKIFVKI